MHGPLKYCRIDGGDIRETMGEVMGRVLMIVAVLSVTPRAHLNLKSGDNSLLLRDKRSQTCCRCRNCVSW